MNTKVLGMTRGIKALDSAKACAWAVVSASANFFSLYDSEFEADSMLRDPSAPNDAVMFAVQEVPGTRRVARPT